MLVVRPKVSSQRRAAAVPTNPYRFGVIHSPECLAEVLELRRVTHLAAGKVEPMVKAEEMAEPRDWAATMVVAERGDQMVAAIRLVPPLEGTILHCDCALEGDFETLPPKNEMIEASSGCVHPEHQGKGLLWPLLAHAWSAAARIYGRPYLVGACEDSLWPMWDRCGFRRLPIFYQGAVTGRSYQVMLLELAPVLAGQGIDPRLARALEALDGGGHPQAPTPSLGAVLNATR